MKKVAQVFLLVLCLLPLTLLAQTGRMEKEIFVSINDYRVSKGLAPLQLSRTISDIARRHSQNMATGRVAPGHIGFQERVIQIFKKPLGNGQGAAENVALGQMTADEAVAGWLKSSGHRKNIIGNYNQTGIGIAKSRDGQYYFTQIFIRQPDK